MVPVGDPGEPLWLHPQHREPGGTAGQARVPVHGGGQAALRVHPVHDRPQVAPGRDADRQHGGRADLGARDELIVAAVDRPCGDRETRQGEGGGEHHRGPDTAGPPDDVPHREKAPQAPHAPVPAGRLEERAAGHRQQPRRDHRHGQPDQAGHKQPQDTAPGRGDLPAHHQVDQPGHGARQQDGVEHPAAAGRTLARAAPLLHDRPANCPPRGDEHGGEPTRGCRRRRGPGERRQPHRGSGPQQHPAERFRDGPAGQGPGRQRDKEQEGRLGQPENDAAPGPIPTQLGQRDLRAARLRRIAYREEQQQPHGHEQLDGNQQYRHGDRVPARLDGAERGRDLAGDDHLLRVQPHAVGQRVHPREQPRHVGRRQVRGPEEVVEDAGTLRDPRRAGHGGPRCEHGVVQQRVLRGPLRRVLVREVGGTAAEPVVLADVRRGVDPGDRELPPAGQRQPLPDPPGMGQGQRAAE